MASKKLIADFKVFRELCIIIRRDYNTYYDLFFSGADDLLKKTAHNFFVEISEIMVRDWHLQVCKLMDPAETKLKGKKYENISIALIDEQLINEGLMSVSIGRLSAELKDYGEKLKPARDKIGAHNDRYHWFKNSILGATTKGELDSFLVNLQEYCDEVGRAIGLGPLDFSSSRGAGDVLDLLTVLREYHQGHDQE